ncbi:MAG TPA: hypothetical protein VHO91_05565, partial [Rhodopila sp.]|nr:hypothetical protein [Rhodopila sp.]
MNFVSNTWHLQDFNQEGEPPVPMPDPAAGPETEPEPVEAVLTNAWTEGYMHAARHLAARSDQPGPMPDLLAALNRMEDRLAHTVEATSLLVARLLLDATTTLGHARWSAGPEDRLQR